LRVASRFNQLLANTAELIADFHRQGGSRLGLVLRLGLGGAG